MLTALARSPGTATYGVFGIKVESPIPLAASVIANPGPDVGDRVVIRYGYVPELGDGEPDLDAGVLCRQSDEGFLFGFDDSVRFAVREGREIIVHEAPDADHDFVRLMLQGSPFGALLHQRGLLALHGCTAVIDGKAVSVIGLSGAGKSTLALALMRRGHALFSDDVAAIRVDAQGIFALPSFREAKLWGDSAERFTDANLRPLWPGIQKFSMPLPALELAEAPLAAIINLDLGDGAVIEVHPVGGAQRLAVLLRNTYRANFLRALGKSQSNYAAASKVAQTLPMWRINRPRKPHMMLEELVDQVERLTR